MKVLDCPRVGNDLRRTCMQQNLLGIGIPAYRICGERAGTERCDGHTNALKRGGGKGQKGIVLLFHNGHQPAVYCDRKG